MKVVGPAKLVREYSEHLGEPVLGAGMIGPGASMAERMFKTMLRPEPAGIRALVVTAERVRIFTAKLVFTPKLKAEREEDLSRALVEIQLIERRRGVIGDRVRLTFKDGEQVNFKALYGGGRAALRLAAERADTAIRRFGSA